eukprot:60329_1
MQPFVNGMHILTSHQLQKSLHLVSHNYLKIHEYSMFKHIQHSTFCSNTQSSTNPSDSEDTKTESYETIEPQFDPTLEHAFDPKFDNLIHGVWTRKDYDRRTGRSESEVGTLGRIFLYQYNCCPFCGKVKSVLDYYNIPYSLIEVSPITKFQLPDTNKFLHDRNVPILLAAKSNTGPNRYHIDQKVTYQSNVIVSTLLEYLCVSGKMPQNEFDRSRSGIIDAWQQWMDNNLIPHLYCAIDYDSYNISYINKLFNDGKNREGEENSTDIMFRYLKEFKKFETMSVTTFPIQQMSAQLFHNQAKQLRFKYGIPNGYDIIHLKDTMNEWHQVTKIAFHGGSKPDIADLMCFGIFRTLSNIALITQLIQETGLQEWYETVEEMIGSHSCVTHA